MEDTTQDHLKEQLMESNEHFRELVDQHTEYDELIQKLESKRALTDADKLEEVRLKKLKLQLKDQIFETLSRHKAEHIN
jgi:uncharacterized protein YdcH (DUF465 family)